MSNAQPPRPEEVVADGTVTVREAERLTGAGRSRLYELMASGELRWVKLGARRLIPRSELRRLLAERLQGGERA